MSDSKWAFSELKHFGPSFMNHFKLKQRVLRDDSLLPYDMMVVDTPGMIDTPLKGEQYRRDNRGYDFLKVVRWFAERSDAILLLFDPNNPGTTGETLDVLTESLVDMDHKLLLILNKVDQFDQAHDFARAYGSLCWNLAKVIRRKDIPRIYTMFTPTQQTSPGQSKPDLFNVNASKPIVSAADVPHAESEIASSRIPLRDFNRTRDEVVAEILKAPQRRVDNIVTTLNEAIARVHLAATISNVIRAGYRKKVMNYYMTCMVSIILGPATVGGCFYLALPMYVTAMSCLGTFGALGGLTWAASSTVKEHRDVALATLDSTFRQIHYKKVEDDYDLLARWEGLKPKLSKALSHMDISEVPAVKPKVLAQLEDIMDREIREMRRECSIRREVRKPGAAAEQEPINP